jgi:hypothetical protein
MTTGHLSAADAALLTELRARKIRVSGQPVSGTQLRSWRRHGLIDAPTVASLGRRGRASSYDVGIVDQVERVAGWLTARRRLDEAVLIAFGLGRNPPEGKLRNAYRTVIDRQEAQAGKILDDEELLARTTRDWFRAHRTNSLDAESEEVPSGTVRRDPVSGDVITPARLRQQAIGELSAAIADGADSVASLAAAIGIDQRLAHATGLSLSDVQDSLSEQRHRSPQELRARVDGADYDDLLQTRDFVRQVMVLAPFATSPGLPQEDDPGQGRLVAMMVAASAGKPPMVTADDFGAAALDSPFPGFMARDDGGAP